MDNASHALAPSITAFPVRANLNVINVTRGKQASTKMVNAPFATKLMAGLIMRANVSAQTT